MIKRIFLHKPLLILVLLLLWLPNSWGSCSDSVMAGPTYCLDTGFLSPAGGESTSVSFQIADSNLSPFVQASVIDNDGDGYFSSEDCDDNDPAVNPGATEVLNDGIDNDCNPATPVNTASGNGLNYPVPNYYASLSLDTNASGWLKYYYSRQRINCVSNAITSVTVSGGIATVTGTCPISGTNNTVTVTISDSNPDAMAIEIRRPDGSLFFNAASQTISKGGFSVVGK